MLSQHNIEKKEAKQIDLKEAEQYLNQLSMIIMNLKVDEMIEDEKIVLKALDRGEDPVEIFIRRNSFLSENRRNFLAKERVIEVYQRLGMKFNDGSEQKSSLKVSK